MTSRTNTLHCRPCFEINDMLVMCIVLLKDKEKAEPSGDSNENTSTAEKPKAKQVGYERVTGSQFFLTEYLGIRSAVMLSFRLEL